ncbi:MAG: hypothetical protein WBM44_25255 [Waterburya sp.]
MENIRTITFSVLFCLTPIALTIHLAIKKAESNTYKKRLGYIYGGLWAIAFLGYSWLFIQ